MKIKRILIMGILAAAPLGMLGAAAAPAAAASAAHAPVHVAHVQLQSGSDTFFHG